MYNTGKKGNQNPGPHAGLVLSGAIDGPSIDSPFISIADHASDETADEVVTWPFAKVSLLLPRWRM